MTIITRTSCQPATYCSTHHLAVFWKLDPLVAHCKQTKEFLISNHLRLWHCPFNKMN
ncbi:hypothetical protein scyTo_0012347, partial [Scyliorhinus torazame]|nr:hypothetical protein [Scyliorhinus torazame]